MKTSNQSKKHSHLPIPTETELLGKHVLDAAFKVHTALGPGLLESAYEACLSYELQRNGLQVKTQVKLPLIYHGIKIDAGYRVDLFVEKCII
jgi:GxxExxY protein